MGSPTVQPGGAPPASPSTLAVDSPNNPPQAQVVGGVTYRPQWDFASSTWDMVDPLGRSLYSTTISPPTATQPQACYLPGFEPASALESLRSNAASAAAELQQQQKMQEALDKMIKERGPELQSLMTQLRNAERSDAPWKDRQAMIDGINGEIRKITDQYAPALPTGELPSCKRQDDRAAGSGGWSGSPSTPNGSHVPLPTNMSYAPDIVPTKAQPFGSVGGIDHQHEAIRSGIQDAYAYDLRSTGAQVANDLERLAGAGYAELHVLSGRHGLPNSSLGSADPQQLALDRTTALETSQRHKGLKVTVYDASNPKELSKFIELQRGAAAGQLAGGATLDAACYGRNRMSDPTGGGPVPTVSPTQVKAEAAVRGGAAIASGGMMIQSGLNDPNKTVGAVKVGVGVTQAAGGSAYVLGMLTDSAGLAKGGAIAGELAGKAVTPLIYYDVYRHMHQHLAEADPRPMSEQKTEALMDGLSLGAAMFAEFALPALALQLVAKPMAEKVAEEAAPVFLGAMSQAYGINWDILSRWAE